MFLVCMLIIAVGLDTIYSGGVIKSHDDFPEGEYDSNTNWIHSIDVNPGNTVELTFVGGLDLEWDSDDYCFDWIKILDGDGGILLNKQSTPDMEYIVDDDTEMCGFYNGSIFSIKSNTNRVEVEFYSDGSANSKGFQIDWKELIAPGEVPVTLASGVVKSHETYPDGSYDTGPNWKETIVVTPGNTIELSFVDGFDIKGDFGCNEDWIKILDSDGSILFNNQSVPGMKSTFSKDDGRTCGFYNGSIISVTSKSSQLTVEFQKERYYTYEGGFQLEWREVVAPTEAPTTTPPPPVKLSFPKNGKRTVKMEKGSQVVVRARAGGRKGAGRSEVNFKLGPTCKKTRFTCSQFNVFSKDKRKCRNGDKMIIINGKREVFCGNKKPVSTSTRRSKVILVTNGKGRNPGVSCTMKCTK